MISGQQTLASIDGALDQARAKAADIEAQLDAANAKVAEMQLAQAQDYRELARLRVDLVADGALIQHLDQAEAQVAKLLEQRQAALADLERQIQAAREARAPLEAERAARGRPGGGRRRPGGRGPGQDPGPPGRRPRLSGPAHPRPGGRAHRPPRRGEGQPERGGTDPEGRLLPGRRPLHVPLGAPLWAAGLQGQRADPLARRHGRPAHRLCRCPRQLHPPERDPPAPAGARPGPGDRRRCGADQPQDPRNPGAARPTASPSWRRPRLRPRRPWTRSMPASPRPTPTPRPWPSARPAMPAARTTTPAPPWTTWPANWRGTT